MTASSTALPRLAYTREEAAEMCGVSVSTITRAVNRGDLEAKKTARTGSGRYLITAAALQAWLDALEDA